MAARKGEFLDVLVMAPPPSHGPSYLSMLALLARTLPQARLVSVVPSRGGDGPGYGLAEEVRVPDYYDRGQAHSLSCGLARCLRRDLLLVMRRSFNETAVRALLWKPYSCVLASRPKTRNWDVGLSLDGRGGRAPLNFAHGLPYNWSGLAYLKEREKDDFARAIRQGGGSRMVFEAFNGMKPPPLVVLSPGAVVERS